MSEPNHTETPAPADDSQPCEDCATSGEKVLAILALLFGLFIVATAVDMYTGGKITGMVKQARGD